MRRRTFLQGMVAGAAGESFDLGSNASSRATSIPASDAPEWQDAGPVVIADLSGAADSLFFRRRGWYPVFMDDIWQKQQTEEAVRKLHEVGVTWATLALTNGFGMEAEKEMIANSRKLAALMRQFGIRVGVYIGDTISYETFLVEKPEAKDWFVPDYLGYPVTYPHQTYRKRVYCMHPGYREYIKQLVRVAIEDLKVDFIEIDNVMEHGEPENFLHPLAIVDFRNWLPRRYTPAELKDRFGFADVRYVEPPRPSWTVTTLDDPLLQEWTEFRCQQVGSYLAEMKQFSRSLNPQVTIVANTTTLLGETNTRWVYGIDFPTLAPHISVMGNEASNLARVSPDGILISNIRSYKMAANLHQRIWVVTTRREPSTDGSYVIAVPSGIVPGMDTLVVQMAECLAYNRQCAGSVGGGLSGYTLSEQERNYIKFLHDHFALYRGVQSAAEVAVLYSRASMGLNSDGPPVSFMLFTQTLIQAKIPFDLIFDEQLRDVGKYRVLVLANQECLADEQGEVIRHYVQEGGGVVATEHTSLYTERRRRRNDFGLKDLFQLKAPAWQGVTRPEALLSVGTLRHSIGKGRVAYIDAVKAAIEKPAGAPMSNQYWKLPTNWEDLVEAVRWAMGGEPLLEVHAPLTVTAELLRQTDTGKLLLHLINFAAPQIPAVEDIQVRLRLGKEPQEVTLHSPDLPGPGSITHRMRGGVLTFTVPALHVYNVVAIS